MAKPLSTPVTVVGDLAIDLIDDRPPSPGGCPSFTGPALAELEGAGQILTAAASKDLPLFEEMLGRLPVACRVVDASATSSFRLRYHGLDDRILTVEAIGPRWDVEQVATLTGWVHLAGLLRSDFPLETVEELHRNGCRISFDGQGLLRVPELGPLRYDLDFDRDLLQHMTILKLSEEEADILTSQSVHRASIFRLGVPEVLVT